MFIWLNLQLDKRQSSACSKYPAAIANVLCRVSFLLLWLLHNCDTVFIFFFKFYFVLIHLCFVFFSSNLSVIFCILAFCEGINLSFYSCHGYSFPFYYHILSGVQRLCSSGICMYSTVFLKPFVFQLERLETLSRKFKPW